MSPDELDKFTKLNNAYRAKFGFPFIMAVKGKNKGEILSAFETRLHNDTSTEAKAALREIDRIAALRIRDILG